jgi:hypothetical protein
MYINKVNRLELMHKVLDDICDFVMFAHAYINPRVR